jgi:hypothetical protein
MLAAGMMAFFGIFLSTVGMEPIRYTRASPSIRAGWRRAST